MSNHPTIVKDISDTYDELPYISKPFSQTHPSNLRAVCSLFDFTTPPVETANILEIGCAFGGNIIPLAQEYPNAHCVGLDLSPKQIALGQDAVKAMQLKNIELKQQDITTYEVPAKHFDYIICHGVYSWVPEPVRQAILRVISEGLSANGVAIVSYNTYPGWKIREVYRDAMRYRSESIKSVRDQVSYGFGMLDFLKAHLPKNSPWGVAIDQYYDGIRQASPSYIAHEYLELVNEPCYFHQFMQLAQAHHLTFVAEADFQNHFYPPVSLDKETQAALKREANGDIIRLEQLNDYLSNRTFRQTLLTHKHNHGKISTGKEDLNFDILSNLHIQGTFTKQTGDNANQWQSSITNDSIQFKNTPITQSIFEQLNLAQGQTVQVADILKQFQATHKDVSKADFFAAIAELVLRRAVRIRSHAVTWQVADMQRPYVPASNRALVTWLKDNPNTIGLTSVFHEPITPEIVAFEIIPLLDGKHSQEELIQHLIEATKAQRVVFHNAQQAVINDPEGIKNAAQEHIHNLLNTLQHYGILQSPE